MKGPTIDTPAEGHEVRVSRRALGGDPITGRTQYGTQLRCECGWIDRTNNAPPSRSKRWQNASYADHLANLPEVEPVIIPDPLPELLLQSNSRPVLHWLETSEKFDLNAPYQRGSLWTIDQRRNLIKSLLLRLPVGGVITAFTGYGSDTCYRVVDGKQRIEAVQAFHRGEFTVPGWWFEPRYLEDPDARSRDIVWSDLTLNGRRSIDMSILPEIQFDSQTEITRTPDGKFHRRKRTPEEMIRAEAELYLLVNFGGVAQTEADQARAQEVADR